MTAVEITEHIDALHRQGDLLALAAERAGLDASVPPCPPWQVKDLLRHTGYVHRWAARHINECPDTVLDGPPEADILRGEATDADSATGVRPEYDPDFAADGIDELITGFGQRRKYRPSPDHDGGMRVRTTDTGHAWHVATQDGRPQARREPPGSDPVGPAACTVVGPASGVYLLLWNRSVAAQAGVTISGDTHFLDLWQSSVRVRWD